MAENAALKIWNAIEPLIKREIETQTRNCQRMKSMMVSTAYSAQTGVVGVTEAFGKEIFLPVVSTMDKSKLVAGASVWVCMPYSSMSNAIVTMMGDGNNGQNGNVTELAATELAGKSNADRAAMYAAGTRLLKVVNGDTEVLLGLDADGSTEWLGSNKPLRNLLDNSDFTNPVNQRGQTSYAGSGYSIDRWRAWVDSNTLTIGNGCIITNGQYAQYVKGLSESEYSAFAMQSDGTLIQIGTGYESANDWRYVSLPAGTYKWAALYEGSYTADTLPPYTPKGYAAELAECQRYYQFYKSASYPVMAWGNNASQAAITLYMPIQMRVQSPTIQINEPDVFIDGTGAAKTLSSYEQLNSNPNSLCMRIRTTSTTGWTKGDIGILITDITLSADL